MGHARINMIFPDEGPAIERLRATDAGFDELCEHLELLLSEFAPRFGALDQATTDLISSFEDVRREIERNLARESARHTKKSQA